MTSVELEKARLRRTEKGDRRKSVIGIGTALFVLFGFIAFLNLIDSVNLAFRATQNNLERFLYWLVVATLGFIGPYGFYVAKLQREVKQIERRLPDFLRDVAEDERRIAMSTYIAVIYISFMVFLVTIWILDVTFLPKMLEASGALASTGGAVQSPLAQDLPGVVNQIRIAFFIATVVHGLGDGILGDKGIKVKSPKVSSVEETSLGKITTIPKIVQRNMNEIEIQPILKNFSYVRILYDTMANEYFYEAIEPKLIEEESEILDVLKEILVENLEMLDDADRARKENYLRRIVDGLLRELGVELHPVSKERVLYYVYRDFIRYGPIDVVMTDIQVEDVSCDGVRVPLYIYHRKYGSIPSNLKFDNAEELDSFVVWLAQRSGKHISVAQPMLDATIPDGSRLQATLGMHVTKRGSSFTIRRFRENPFTPLDLVRFKTMSPEMMAYLWLAIENGQSMLICGGTA